jgi:hypothetical protein
MRDTSIASEIGQRCDRIVKEGEDPHYAEGLDHYTTLRVKAAFLRMNEQELIDRLSEVRKILAELLLCVRGAAFDVAASWTCPDATAVPCDRPVADPNALPVPQACDYDLAP